MCMLIHVRYALFVSYLNGTWILSTDFSRKKNSQISALMKICSVVCEFRADRQTWSHYSLSAISRMRLISMSHIFGDRSFHCLFLATWWTPDFCLTHSSEREVLCCTSTVQKCPIVGWGMIELEIPILFLPLYFPSIPCGLRHLVL
jgi:hypothetical protein